MTYDTMGLAKAILAIRRNLVMGEPTLLASMRTPRERLNLIRNHLPPDVEMDQFHKAVLVAYNIQLARDLGRDE